MTRVDFFDKLRLCAAPGMDVAALTQALTDLPTAPDLTQIARLIPQTRP